MRVHFIEWDVQYNEDYQVHVWVYNLSENEFEEMNEIENKLKRMETTQTYKGIVGKENDWHTQNEFH